MKYGKNITIKENVQIGKNVTLEDGVYIDYNTILRDNVHVKKNSYIGSNCIIGEYTSEFFKSHINNSYSTSIGEDSIVRSGTIIYDGCKIGKRFQTGHRVTIRENTCIGDSVRIGTLSDIQFECELGNYVNIHSNVFVGEKTRIENYVWIFPGVTITNDPLPPSNILRPVYIKSFASIAARAVILPGVIVGENSLVAAGSVVTRNVNDEEVVMGNPAKKIKTIRDITDKISGEKHYPWRENFERGMPWEGIGYLNWENQKKY